MSAISAEIRKATSTRATAALAIGAIAVVAIGTFATVSSTADAGIGGPLHAHPLFTVAAVNLSLFAVVLGARTATDEMRHRTIVWTLLAEPARVAALLAKIVLAAVAAVATTMVAAVVAAAVAIPVSTTGGGGLDLVTADLGYALRLAAATGLWAAIGVAVGSLVRHQVVAIVGLVVWVLAVENLAAALTAAGSYLPVQAGLALAGAGEGSALTPAVAAAVLVLQAIAVGGLALWDFRRRPITPAI